MNKIRFYDIGENDSKLITNVSDEEINSVKMVPCSHYSIVRSKPFQNGVTEETTDETKED